MTVLICSVCFLIGICLGWRCSQAWEEGKQKGIDDQAAREQVEQSAARIRQAALKRLYGKHTGRWSDL